MLPEIVAVAVVEPGEIDTFGRGEPAAGLVIDEDAANAIRRFAGRQIGLELCDGLGARPVELEAVDQPNQDRIGELERVVGVLGQRVRQIGHVDFGVPEIGIARLPFAPGAQAEDSHANQHDEAGRPERKTRLAEFAACDHQVAPNRRKPLTLALTACCNVYDDLPSPYSAGGNPRHCDGFSSEDVNHDAAALRLASAASFLQREADA